MTDPGVFLKQNGIVFVFLRIKNNLPILLVEFLTVYYSKHNIFFLSFSEPFHEYLVILFNLLDFFRWYILSEFLHIFDWVIYSKSFDELPMFILGPADELVIASYQLVVLIFEFFRNNLITILEHLNSSNDIRQSLSII